MQEAKERSKKIIPILEKEYYSEKIALRYRNPLELLIATILSAQCTDRKVNEVTEILFKKYTTIESYANAELKELEKDVKQTGFYRNKAKNIQLACKMLIENFGSQVPRSMNDLIKIRGVARKTANIVLSNAYGIIEGIAVDTHVSRLSKRLGLTREKNPNKIEEDLMKIIPRNKWSRITNLLIFHGRKICKARKPKCSKCILAGDCPSSNMET